MANSPPPLTPCLFSRRVLPKIWGGYRLREELGIDLPGAEPIGETWEVCDREEFSSPLRDDPEERTLADLVADQPEALFGSAMATDGRFPLILKFLDASQPLSVQVHPDTEQAREEGDGRKEEAWVVLASGRDGRIVRGFRDGTTRQQIEAAAGTAEIEGLLHDFAPRAGDVVHLPPGVVHTVGPDVVLFEVQQNSDLTYRLWDGGRDRELHVDQALRAIDTDIPTRPEYVQPQPLGPGEELLIDSPAFRIQRRRIEGPSGVTTEGVFKLVTVLRGRAALGWRSGGAHPPMPVGPGDTALLPACIPDVFLSPIGPLEILITGPGGAN